MINKFGKFIAKNRIWVLILATLMLIPAIYGFLKTPINYNLLTYLPEELNSMKGQEIIDQKFNTGATSILMIENMEDKDVVELKNKISQINGVEDVIGVDDALDISIPTTILPSDIRDMFYHENSTMVIIRFVEEVSSEQTFNAIDEIRNYSNKQCFLSGLSVITKDTKDLMDKETPSYVLIAILLSSIVLALTNSAIIPLVLLVSMSFCVVYNFGTNMIFGKISYITKALATVLQLGITMDYSIFLLHRYNEERENYSNKEEAMAGAIQKTIVSISSSSLTTMVGFLALCTMELLIGKDIGLVMAKGVLFGLIGTVTILPASILIFDRMIQKKKRVMILPSFTKVASFLSKHYVVFAILFVLLFIPAIYGNNHTQVYYTLEESLPKNLPSIVATSKLKDEYNMTTTHFIVVNENLPNYQVKDMIDQIENIDGIENSIAYRSIIGEDIPESFVPEEVKKTFRKDGYQLIIANSKYRPATDEQNKQISNIIQIVKQYDANGYVAGEGALNKDFIEIADTDFKKVNIASIVAVFIILLFVFQSISIPIILVASIELAIFINMSISYYTGTVLPFIASIVIGCIQLGATIDYAILYTNRYREEMRCGKEKIEATRIAIQESSRSIATSALTFFAATVGVGIISKMDMVKSLCVMLSRGAIISMLVIIYILPSLLLVNEKIISITTFNWRGKPKCLITSLCEEKKL